MTDQPLLNFNGIVIRIKLPPINFVQPRAGPTWVMSASLSSFFLFWPWGERPDQQALLLTGPAAGLFLRTYIRTYVRTYVRDPGQSHHEQNARVQNMSAAINAFKVSLRKYKDRFHIYMKTQRSLHSSPSRVVYCCSCSKKRRYPPCKTART